MPIFHESKQKLVVSFILSLLSDKYLGNDMFVIIKHWLASSEEVGEISLTYLVRNLVASLSNKSGQACPYRETLNMV